MHRCGIRGEVLTLARHSAAVLSARLASTGLAIAATLVLARTLGPQGNGAYTLTVLLQAIVVMFATFGLPIANSFFVGKGLISAERASTNSVGASLVLGGATAVAAAVAVWMLRSSVFRDVPAFGIGAALVLVPIGVLTQSLTGVLLGMNRVQALSALSLVHSAFLAVGVVILDVFGQLRLETAVAAWTAATLAACIACAVVTHARTPLAIEFDRQIVARSIRFGIAGYLTNLVGVFNLRLDVFLVGAFVGTAAVGQYAAAVAVAETTWYVSSAMATALFPRLASASPSEAMTLLTQSSRNGVLIGAGTTAMLFAVAPLVPTVLGPNYARTSTLLAVLLPGMFAYALAPVWSAFLTAHLGKPHLSLYIAGTSLLIDVSLNLVFLPRVGVIGAAWASTIAYGVASILGLLIVLSQSGLSWQDVLRVRGEDVRAVRNAAARVFSR